MCDVTCGPTADIITNSDFLVNLTDKDTSRFLIFFPTKTKVYRVLDAPSPLSVSLVACVVVVFAPWCAAFFFLAFAFLLSAAFWFLVCVFPSWNYRLQSLQTVPNELNDGRLFV